MSLPTYILFVIASLTLFVCAGTLEPEPPPSVGDFAEIVFDGCQRYGCSSISFFRTPNHNRDVGGIEDSKHLEGLAMDLFFDRASRRDAAAGWFLEQGLEIEYNGTRAMHVEIGGK